MSLLEFQTIDASSFLQNTERSPTNMISLYKYHPLFFLISCCCFTHELITVKPCHGWLLLAPASPLPRLIPTFEQTLLPHFNRALLLTVNPSHLFIATPLELSTPILPFFLAFIALAIGLLANGWIARLLSGDQGLGSFLSDGSGFQKSGFRPSRRSDADRAVQLDPLPWLTLPQLDFVEVAGQERRSPSFPKDMDDVVVAQLELIRGEMQEQLRLGNTNEAERLRLELERRMKIE